MSSIFLKTKLNFGIDAISTLSDFLVEKKFKKIMLVYGGGSIKKNGIYDAVVNQINKANIPFIEYSGVKPNPEHDHTFRGARLAEKNKVNCLLSVGGGSTTDATKVMATLATNKHIKDCWDYVTGKTTPKVAALPVIAVVTLAGSASENNSVSVISNAKTLEKRSVTDPTATPIAAYLDPQYTYTVNKWQTASGIFDCFSHLLEQYYEEPIFEWTKQYIFANLRTLIKYAPIAIRSPKNYEARANILITTTMALNGIASFETVTDWNVHKIEHAISALWDVTHGAGLALITPTYIKYRSNHDPKFHKQTEELASEVFNSSSVDGFLSKLKTFIKTIGLPAKFNDFKEINTVTPENRKYLVKHIQSQVDSKTLEILEKIIGLIP